MADFVKYTPTAGLTSAERTRAGYYGAIRDWAVAAECFALFNVTYDDATCVVKFMPKAENVAAFGWWIEVSPENLQYDGVYFHRSYGSNATYSIAGYSDFRTDVVFNIYYNGTDSFAAGMAGNMCYYALLPATAFDSGDKIKAVLSDYNSNFYYHTGGTTSVYNSNAAFNTVAQGKSETYRIQQMPIPNTVYMLDNVYYFDGGIGNPPAGVFLVGEDKYCTIYKNVAMRMG